MRLISTSCEQTPGRIPFFRSCSKQGEMRVGSAFAAGIVDKIYFFYAPKVLGGDDGIPMCRGAGPERMQDSLDIHDLSVFRFDTDVMLQGYLKPR